MSALPAAATATEVMADGRTARLAALFDAHHERLYRLARRLVPTADDALDLVQDTYLRAARALASIPEGMNAEEAWLVRVLVNLRRDQWRKEAVRRRPDPFPSVPETTSGPEQALVARDAIWRALDRLAPRRRAVLVMHELEELPVSSIADMLGVARVTVRWHVAVGRRELASAVMEMENTTCAR